MIGDLFLRKRVEYWYLLLALFFGFLMLLATPPFRVADEESHFFRAYQLTEVNSWTVQRTVVVPDSLTQLINIFHVSGMLGQQDKLGAIPFKQALHQSTETKSMLEIDIHNTAARSGLFYLPQWLGIQIGMWLGLKPIYLFYLGRIVNLLLTVTIMFFAIRRMPVIKEAFAFLALTPLLMQVIASYSSDALTIGFAFLWIASVLEMANMRSHWTFPRTLFLFFLAIMLAQTKVPYVLLVGFVLILPRERFRSLKESLWVKCGCIVLAGVGSLPWILQGKKLYSGAVNPFYHTKLQLVMSHPVQFFSGIFMFYTKIGASLLFSAMGPLCWNQAPLPRWLLIILVAFLFLAMLTNVGEQKNRNILSKQAYWITIFVIVALLISIPAILYLSFVKHLYFSDFELQGRYLLPFFPLFLLLGNQLIQKAPKYLERIVCYWPVVAGSILSWGIVGIITHYY